MIRSSVFAFVVVCLCFAILQVPGTDAAGPSYELLPLPGDCPGGVCPVPKATSVSVMAPVSMAPISMIRSSPTWTYPGDIASHLANGHGVSSAGMTTAQAVAMHDSLHNGYPTSSSVQYIRRTPVRITARAVAAIRPLQRVANTVRGVGRVLLFRRCR